jgi:sulfur-oxidizing protein SoxZ
MITNPRIVLPTNAKIGDVIDVKTVVNHVMETGNRKDVDGKLVPRNIISTLTVTFGGEEVFRAEFGPGISANPFVTFPMRVTGPGVLEVTWLDDLGTSLKETAVLEILAEQ